MSADHISMDVISSPDTDEELTPLMCALKRRLDSMPSEESHHGFTTIYRASGLMKDPELYQPCIVSIGPYNRDRMRCKDMEEYKWRFFREILALKPSLLKSFTSKMKDLEERARNCYEDNSSTMSSDEFIQMLLLDGCFIFMLLLKLFRNWDPNFIENVYTRIPHIRSDLLLLENQLPLFVIYTMFCIFERETYPDNYDSSFLHQALYEFFMDDFNNAPVPSGEIHHLLHLVYDWSLSNLTERKFVQNRGMSVPFQNSGMSVPFRCFQVKERRRTIPNATWLVKAGVKFKNNQSSYRFFDVVFEKGVLKVPTFRIDSEQMSRLANLMVFEQSKEWGEWKVTSYVLFMDSLIDTAGDVELLKNCDVIQNTLESNNAAAAFFNRLGEHCPMDHKRNYYAPLFDQVWDFYGSKWNRNKASLKSKYFGSPWAAISVVGAGLLMALTGLQTYYTIAGYYHC